MANELKIGGQMPPALRGHGFVADLIHGVTRAANDIGRPVTTIEYEGEYYIAVRVPTESELAEIDRFTAEETAVPFIGGFALDQPDGAK